MAVEVFINFNGNCREAVEFYAAVFGTEKPVMMSFGDSPHECPEFPLSEEVKGLVAYTSITIHGSTVMFSDVPPGMSFIPGNNMTLSIGSKNMDEIKTLFNQLKEGGTVDMDLQETFWSKYYGSVTDKFGIQWQFNYDDGQVKISQEGK